MPGLAAQTPGAGADADALARALQQRYQTITDFSADFVHTYRGGVLRTQTRERGTVKIKKPGKMRWVYTAPERKEFVSDGVKIYSHIPQDRQVHGVARAGRRRGHARRRSSSRARATSPATSPPPSSRARWPAPSA